MVAVMVIAKVNEANKNKEKRKKRGKKKKVFGCQPAQRVHDKPQNKRRSMSGCGTTRGTRLKEWVQARAYLVAERSEESVEGAGGGREAAVAHTYQLHGRGNGGRGQAAAKEGGGKA